MHFWCIQQNIVLQRALHFRMLIMMAENISYEIDQFIRYIQMIIPFILSKSSIHISCTVLNACFKACQFNYTSKLDYILYILYVLSNWNFQIEFSTNLKTAFQLKESK